MCLLLHLIYFFFNDTATTEIYTLSLHDALPISDGDLIAEARKLTAVSGDDGSGLLFNIHLSSTAGPSIELPRSEEHTSELQSRLHLVCRLLLEKKKKTPRTAPRRLWIRDVRPPQ